MSSLNFLPFQTGTNREKQKCNVGALGLKSSHYLAFLTGSLARQFRWLIYLFLCPNGRKLSNCNHFWELVYTWQGLIVLYAGDVLLLGHWTNWPSQLCKSPPTSWLPCLQWLWGSWWMALRWNWMGIVWKLRPHIVVVVWVHCNWWPISYFQEPLLN